jgi:molybdate transport system substrate-binding protein
MSKRTRNLITLLAIMFVCQFCPAQAITVAAAADLQFAMQDVAAYFQKETGKEVKLIYGSSGTFFQQLQNGAPFDMFFSANLVSWRLQCHSLRVWVHCPRASDGSLSPRPYLVG